MHLGNRTVERVFAFRGINRVIAVRFLLAVSVPDIYNLLVSLLFSRLNSWPHNRGNLDWWREKRGNAYPEILDHFQIKKKIFFWKNILSRSNISVKCFLSLFPWTVSSREINIILLSDLPCNFVTLILQLFIGCQGESFYKWRVKIFNVLFLFLTSPSNTVSDISRSPCCFHEKFSWKLSRCWHSFVLLILLFAPAFS